MEKGGHALINRDDKRWRQLEKAARREQASNMSGVFGQNGRANLQVDRVAAGCGGFHGQGAACAGEEHTARIGLPGRHIVQNALAVMGAGLSWPGADMDKIMLALSGVRAGEGRGRRHRLAHPKGAFTLIDESYNRPIPPR